MRLWLADVFAASIRFSYVHDFLDVACGFTSFSWYLDVACILPNAGVPATAGICTGAGVPATAGICTGAGALPPTACVSAVSDVYAATCDLAQGKPLAHQL